MCYYQYKKNTMRAGYAERSIKQLWPNVEYIINIVFITLLLVECEVTDEKFWNTLTKRITANAIKDIKKCADESMWLFCNMFFPTCKHDGKTNQWRYIPPCRESCRSFLNTKHCIPFFKFAIFVWDKIVIACPNVAEHNEVNNCSVYPRSGSKECQYRIFGKPDFVNFTCYNLRF